MDKTDDLNSDCRADSPPLKCPSSNRLTVEQSSNATSPGSPKIPYEKTRYRGASMNPLLKNGDLLYITPCAADELQPGDVVVFEAPEQRLTIAHRIVSIDSCGVITKGDNNPVKDCQTVDSSLIRGKVEYLRRGRKLLPVRGGYWGRIAAQLCTARKFLVRAVVGLLRPIYRIPALSGILAPVIPGRIRSRIVCFRSSGKIQLHLLMGKRVVGVLPPGEAHWTIKPPFRLFIDESCLPRDCRDWRLEV